ncbi:kinase inhibitor [Pseudomonas sp. efr-133-TYG-103a]|uniref:kinase inhibitor n=1 Tax=Pseudomonas sp. efr-133-TYG-103a TaxID=3040308 RepID=UPI002555F5A1|nr:kinase inhibitor [Pseudomonas sp. efr-133-TYG-103a]
MKIKLIPLAVCLGVSLTAHAADFALTSRDIADNRSLTRREVFNGFGCEGGNISPELSWRHAPEGTKSFAVTVYDPEAPTGSGWWHWTVFNLTASTHGLPSGAGAHLPVGAVQGRTDYGQPGFGGVCPPVGDKPHHYQFTVWALKVEKLPLDEQASGALVGYMLNANVLGKATITPTYARH